MQQKCDLKWSQISSQQFQFVKIILKLDVCLIHLSKWDSDHIDDQTFGREGSGLLYLLKWSLEFYRAFVTITKISFVAVKSKIEL